MCIAEANTRRFTSCFGLCQCKFSILFLLVRHYSSHAFPPRHTPPTFQQKGRTWPRKNNARKQRSEKCFQFGSLSLMPGTTRNKWINTKNRNLTDFTTFVGVGQAFVRFLGLFGSRGRRDGADDGGGFERVRSGKEGRPWYQKVG